MEFQRLHQESTNRDAQTQMATAQYYMWRL